MIGIYVRVKIDGKRTFRAAPTEPGNFECWLKSSYNVYLAVSDLDDEEFGKKIEAT